MKIKLLALMILILGSIGVSAQTTADIPSTPFKLPAAHESIVASITDVQFPVFDSVKTFCPLWEESENESNVNESDELINRLTDFAAKYIGTRYRHGASGPKAFDCSGFVGYVFRHFGIQLGRSSRTQYNEGETVNKNDLRPGDLMFFAGRGGRGAVGHVALVVDVNEDGSCTFIHASSSQGVVYQKFPDGGYYSKRYVGAKRVVGIEPKA